MFSSQAGVKYGLQIRSKPEQQKQQGGKAKEKKLPPPPSIFGEDEDDDIESEIAREALKKRSKREIEQQHAAALEQDAAIFDYDGVYDEMKGAQGRRKEEEKTQRQSKYIGSLLEKAKARQREQEIVHERLLSKERAKEDHLYGDKEKFVTRAYKEKLAEQARWLEDEKRREALEAANDVTKREDLSDFYRNLMKSNVAFGGKLQEGSPPQAREPPPAQPAHSEQGRPGRRGEPEHAVRPVTDAQGPSQPAAGPETKATADTDAGTLEAQEGEEASEAQPGGQEARPAQTSCTETGPSLAPAPPPQEGASSAAVPIDTKGREDKAAAARERYLARKRQRG